MISTLHCTALDWTLLYLPLEDGGVLPSDGDQPGVVRQEGEAGDRCAVTSVLVVATLHLTGGGGEQSQLAGVLAHHQQPGLLAGGGRGEVHLVPPHPQAGPGEEAVRGGPGDVPGDLSVGEDPAEAGGEDDDLPLLAVGLQVLAVPAPVQAGQEGGPGQTAASPGEGPVVLLHSVDLQQISSITIGPPTTLLSSHWSRASEC